MEDYRNLIPRRSPQVLTSQAFKPLKVRLGIGTHVLVSDAAAVLSTTSLLATPYAFAYDIAAIAVPLAFLARDQMRHGFLRAEQSIAIVLFTLTFAVLLAFGDRQGGVTFGNVPLGPFVLIALLALVLRLQGTRAVDRHTTQTITATPTLVSPWASQATAPPPPRRRTSP
jgi:hypothetical protein